MSFWAWLFGGQPLAVRGVTPTAQSIAEAFATNPVVRQDIGAHQINELAIEWKGHRVEATWYPSGSPRSLEIDRKAYPATNSADADYVIASAQHRATALLAEAFAALESDLA